MMHAEHMGKMKQMMASEVGSMKPASTIGPGRSAEQAKKSIVGKLKQKRGAMMGSMGSMRDSMMSNVSGAIGRIRRK